VEEFCGAQGKILVAPREDDTFGGIRSILSKNCSLCRFIYQTDGNDMRQKVKWSDIFRRYVVQRAGKLPIGIAPRMAALKRAGSSIQFRPSPENATIQ
jgi:hypothetical protein